MIEVDGSAGEGGGAILRTAIALSAVSGSPLRMFNIRAKRDRPGLQPQHLKAVEALARLTNAEVDGLQLHSTEITFKPGSLEGGRHHIDIGTAGSTTLILQALMPAAAFTQNPVEVEINGGTDNPFAPPVDFLKNVTLPTLRKMGYRGEVVCLQRGHYPKGGGVLRAKIEPVEKLMPLHLTGPGKVAKVSGLTHAVRLPEKIAVRMAHAASSTLIQFGHSNVKIKTETYEPSQDPHLGPGTGITLWAETENGAVLGASSLGKLGKPAEQVGKEAAENLAKEIKTGAAVDRHLTDQLIPYLALAEGVSEITSSELTMHTLTNISLVEQILGVKFEVNGEQGKPGSIRVQGMGFLKLKTLI
ncbi:MAG: RNA 3'-terminal phosphate cyclase [Candidatus Hadarchaeota archaeon]